MKKNTTFVTVSVSCLQVNEQTIIGLSKFFISEAIDFRSDGREHKLSMPDMTSTRGMNYDKYSKTKINLLFCVSNQKIPSKKAWVEELSLILRNPEVIADIKKLREDNKIIPPKNEDELLHHYKKYEENIKKIASSSVKNVKEVFHELDTPLDNPEKSGLLSFFAKWKINKYLWSAITEYIEVDSFDLICGKFNLRSEIRVTPYLRSEGDETVLRIDLLPSATLEDLDLQREAIKNLMRINGLKRKRKKRNILEYEKIIQSLKIKKESGYYLDPQTGKKLSRDLSKYDLIDSLYGESDGSDDKKKDQRIRKSIERIRKLGQ